MNTISFKCTLLSDIIINQKAATEGNQQTLDFIPGSVFLGIAANMLYTELSAEESMLLFHSGKVRFGDAHPLVNNKRAVRVPASWYHKKGDDQNSEIYIHHGLKSDGIKDENGNIKQPKQYRDGFIAKMDIEQVAKIIKVEKQFFIKSAYDSEKRRSEDEKMYGYQSIKAGAIYCFDVQFNDEVLFLKNKIAQSLEGKKRVGRSSTAQYGLVDIRQSGDNKTPIGFNCYNQEIHPNTVLIYAESRLIFMDKFGQPTFAPTVDQFGIKKGEIKWEKSQIRTFQYSPYNNYRKTHEADRCGIEKGSVFFITNGELPIDIDNSILENGVGVYLNEGFGKILVNPEFLQHDNSGKALFSIDVSNNDADCREVNPNMTLMKADQKVLDYLQRQKKKKDDQLMIYSLVNVFKKDHLSKFNKEAFASQWGAIRSIAMRAVSKEDLYEILFEEKEGYLEHGVAKDKWEERNRKKELKEFINKKELKEIAIEAVINLAAEMAKACKKEEKENGK